MRIEGVPEIEQERTTPNTRDNRESTRSVRERVDRSLEGFSLDREKDLMHQR